MPSQNLSKKTCSCVTGLRFIDIKSLHVMYYQQFDRSMINECLKLQEIAIVRILFQIYYHRFNSKGDERDSSYQTKCQILSGMLLWSFGSTGVTISWIFKKGNSEDIWRLPALFVLLTSFLFTNFNYRRNRRGPYQSHCTGIFWAKHSQQSILTYSSRWILRGIYHCKIYTSYSMV